MNNQKYIILGLTPQGLALLRELGKAGADVTAFCSSKRNVGYHSRYGEKICYHNMAELKQYITQIVADHKAKPICYITSGEILASILREYKELYDVCNVYSGPYSVIEMLAHKDKMYEYAAKKGFLIAKYATLDKAEVNDLHYPLFLKRNYEIPLFFKAVKINTPEEFQSYVNRISEENKKDVIAQEYIDVPKNQLINISCQGFWTEGRCAGFYVANQKRRLRKGITSYIKEIEDKNILKLMNKLINNFMSELKYNGFAEFEFMYDTGNNNLWFVEVNTRTCGLQSAMSHKFSNLANVILRPDKYQPLQSIAKPLHWMNIQRDIRARIENNDWKHLGDIFHAHYDILDIKDLKPFFRQFI